jgi:hypothetical protein
MPTTLGRPAQWAYPDDVSGSVLERLAVLVCPPELDALGLRTALLREVRLQLGCLPAVARRAVGPALWAFEIGALARTGRRFTRLDVARADAYLRSVLYGRSGGTVLRLVKSVVVLCYYDLPEVRSALGYHPNDYVAEVKARRIALYGKEIGAS